MGAGRLVQPVLGGVAFVAWGLDQGVAVDRAWSGRGAGTSMPTETVQLMGGRRVQRHKLGGAGALDDGRTSSLVARGNCGTSSTTGQRWILASAEGGSEAGMGVTGTRVAVEEEVSIVSGSGKDSERVAVHSAAEDGDVTDGASDDNGGRLVGTRGSRQRVQSSAAPPGLPSSLPLSHWREVVSDEGVIFRTSDSALCVLHDSVATVEVSSSTSTGWGSGGRETVWFEGGGIHRRYAGGGEGREARGGIEAMGVAGIGRVGLVLGGKERLGRNTSQEVSGVTGGRWKESSSATGCQGAADTCVGTICTLSPVGSGDNGVEISGTTQSCGIGDTKRAAAGMGVGSDSRAGDCSVHTRSVGLIRKETEHCMEENFEGGSVDDEWSTTRVRVGEGQHQRQDRKTLGRQGGEVARSGRFSESDGCKTGREMRLSSIPGVGRGRVKGKPVAPGGTRGDAWPFHVQEAVGRTESWPCIRQQWSGGDIQQHAKQATVSVGGRGTLVLHGQRHRAASSVLDSVEGNGTSRGGWSVAMGGRQRLDAESGHVGGHTAMGRGNGCRSIRIWPERKVAKVEQQISRTWNRGCGRNEPELAGNSELCVLSAGLDRAGGGISIVSGGDSSASGSRVDRAYLVADAGATGTSGRALAKVGSRKGDIQFGSIWASCSTSQQLGFLGGEGELAVNRLPPELQQLYKEAVVRMAGSVKAKTLHDYEREMESFIEWRRRWRLGGQLPAEVWQVMAYIEWVCQARGPGVAAKVLVCIEKIHILRMAPLPRSVLLKELAKALDKASKRKRDPEKVSDMPVAAVLAWAAKLKESGCSTLQDRQRLVGLAVALRAIKRAADIAKVQLNHVQPRIGGGVIVFFPDTKNHPEGELVPIEPATGVPVCPSSLLLQWVEERKKQGARGNDLLFVKQRGSMTDSGYWSAAVREAVKEAQRRGWLEQGGKWSSRSLRSGGATRMQALGYGEAAIMALGGWLSKAMQYYLRKTHLAVDNLSSRMFQQG